MTATAPEPDRERRVAGEPWVVDESWGEDEQAALGRVAVLVARAVPPSEVFAAVTEEAGRLLGADHAVLGQYDPGGAVSVIASWDSATVSGQVIELAATTDAQVSVDAPVTVGGRLWGVMTVTSAREPLPAHTEARLAKFAELAGAAVVNAQARTELQGYAAEQAALRRVAMLVAKGSSPGKVLGAVTGEAGRLLGVDFAILSRYDADGLATVVAHWASTDPGRPLVTGLRARPEGRNIHALVFDTGGPAEIDDYESASGTFADLARDFEFRASAGVPIRAEGRLWGVMSVASRSGPLPAGTAARLAGFTELAATTIASAEARVALDASRARIVAAADQTRRKIERDLHDGAQQRLVSLALQLRAAQMVVPPDADELAGRLEGAVREATEVLAELREISRGLHPAILTETGLRPALRALARRSAIPVDLDVRVPGRLPEQIEVTGYYVVAEALTNTTKHAQASAVSVEVEIADDALYVTVRDDGTGGADLTSGAGLAGLKDRVDALGGRFVLDSPRGAGTTVQAEFPIVGTSTGAV